MMPQSTPVMPMETGPSNGLPKTSSFFASQKTVSTDLGIDNPQNHADPNKLPTEDSNGFTGTFRSSRQTLSSYGVERRSPYSTPNSSQKDNNTAQHSPLLRQPPIELIEGLVSISGSGSERKCIHGPAERHSTVGVSDQNRPIAHPNSSAGDTNIDAFSFIKNKERFDGDEIHSQRASSDAELPGNLPSLEGQQSVDSSQDYFSVLSETRDFTSLECIEIQDTEPLDLSSLDVVNPKSPTRNKESRSEVKDCPVSAVSHDRSQKRQFTGTSFDEPTSINQNSDFDEDETFLKIPVTSQSRILHVESTDVENHSEWTTTHAPAEDEQSVGSFQNYFSTQSKSQGVWNENNLSLGCLSPFSNELEVDVTNPEIPTNPDILTNDAVCLEISTETDNVVGSSSIHHEVFTLRKPGFIARSLHMQSTDEVLPIEEPRSLTSTEQQSDSCSVSYFSIHSKTNLCNQVGDSIQSFPNRISSGEDSLNLNDRDSDQCSDGSNEDTSINGSSSMTHDLYLDDLQTLWMKFEIFLRILYLRSTCEEQHFEKSTNQFAEDAQQCIIRVLRDSSTRSKIRNENGSLIQESNSLQSLKANIVGQSSKCENVANTMIPSHSNEVAVSLMDKHSDEKVGGTAKDSSISSYSQSQKVDLDDDALLPIDTNMSPGSPHLQLIDDERHSEDFLNHSAPEIYQCNDSFKNQLTQSLTQNDCVLRISKDSSLQSLDEDLRDQNSCWKNVTNSESLIKNLDATNPESGLDTCDIDLVERSNESIKDTNIESYSQGQESDFDDNALLPIDTNMSPGSPHLQLTDDERHSEDFLNHSAPEIHQCFKNQLTQSLTQNDCELRISKDSSLQSLNEDLRDQNSCWKNVTNSESLIKNHNAASTESGLDTCDIDLVERSNESIKGTSIESYSQGQESDLDDDVLLPIDNNMSPGSPHLQLNGDERHSEVVMKQSAPEIHQCNDSSKHYLTQSMTQNACEWRILRDGSLQGFDADFREQSPWWKYALNSMTLNQHIDTGNPDTSIGSYSQSRESNFNNDALLLMDTIVNPGSEHWQLTNIQRQPYSPPYSAKKYDESKVQRYKDISQKFSPKRKNSDTMIQESPHVDENPPSFAKNKNTANSDNRKDTNGADLHEDKSINRCPEIREKCHSDEDATLPMEIEVNSRSEHLQLTNIQRQPYSPPYSAKKYDEPEVQRCKDISQKSSLKRKNSDTMIQESLHVGGNSASSTKCKKNEHSDNPKNTNDADLHEGLNIDKSIGRCPEIREEFHSDEDATLPMEFEVNLRCRQSTQNMTQNACDTIKGSISLRSKEADIRCRGSLMNIKLSSESPTMNNITNQGILRAKTGTASKEKTNKSTMKVAENSVSLTQNKEIRIPESLGNKPSEKSSYEPTTDTCINRHSHMSQEFDSNEDAVVRTESEINPRSQHLQLIDLERQSEISTNHLAAEVQHCNNRFYNYFPTENETHHIRSNCLLVDTRSFENQDGATLRRGTFSRDAAELDVNEFPNGSATDHISIHGDVVTIYGSAPLSESSYWLGEQYYEVRLSETVRPIDEHNSLMWDDSMEDDDAPMSRHHLANSDDTMDSTDTLPSIRQLLSLSGVQLRTSFIGVNSFQRDSYPTRHESLSYEEYQNDSIPYEMDEGFVDISGSGSLSEPFNGTGERCFQVRFSKTVRPITNRNS